MALEARGDIKYGNKGNMTKEEIDRTIDTMMETKKAGHFRSFWTSFDQSVNLMAAGEVVIQSMWSPAVAAVRSRGIPCTYQPLKEGFRGWGYTLGVMKHVEGLKRDCFYEYLNWYTGGFQGAFIARQGYYSAQPENARKFLSEDEQGYWFDGKPSQGDIMSPFGKVMEKAGNVRDGGSIEQRLATSPLELGDGRGPLPDPQVERVHHVLIAFRSRPSRRIRGVLHAAWRVHPDRQQRLADQHDVAAVHADLRSEPHHRREGRAFRVRFRAVDDQAARLRWAVAVLGPQPGSRSR